MRLLENINVDLDIIKNLNECDKVRVSDLQKIFQSDSLASALEDLYISTVGGGDGLLCWPCAQSEK